MSEIRSFLKEPTTGEVINRYIGTSAILGAYTPESVRAYIGTPHKMMQLQLNNVVMRQKSEAQEVIDLLTELRPDIPGQPAAGNGTNLIRAFWIRTDSSQYIKTVTVQTIPQPWDISSVNKDDPRDVLGAATLNAAMFDQQDLTQIENVLRDIYNNLPENRINNLPDPI